MLVSTHNNSNEPNALESKQHTRFFTQGWIQVAIAFVVAIVTQGFGIYHFSLLRVPMTEALGAQPAEVAFGFSIYALAAGFASLIVGDVINKIKLRGSMLCSAVLFFRRVSYSWIYDRVVAGVCCLYRYGNRISAWRHGHSFGYSEQLV